MRIWGLSYGNAIRVTIHSPSGNREVNSREYAPENIDTGMLKWQKILMAVNVITGLPVVILGALAIRTYLKKKKEER